MLLWYKTLWYKAWMETRWRFLIGLVVVSCYAVGVILVWPKVMELIPLASSIDASGEVGRQIRESAEQLRDYRTYIWSQWFGKDLRQVGTLFAILLGTGGLLSQSAGGAALFTLSMPVSRRRLLATRAAAGLAELSVLAIGPSLLIPLLSPAVGKSYEAGESLINSGCLFIAATVFFSLSFLLSTVFTDVWRPLLIALAAAVVVGIFEQLFRGSSRYMLFDALSSGHSSIGELPWPGLVVRAALSAAMLYGAVIHIARKDF